MEFNVKPDNGVEIAGLKEISWIENGSILGPF